MDVYNNLELQQLVNFFHKVAYITVNLTFWCFGQNKSPKTPGCVMAIFHNFLVSYSPNDKLIIVKKICRLINNKSNR